MMTYSMYHNELHGIRPDIEHWQVHRVSFSANIKSNQTMLGSFRLIPNNERNNIFYK